MQYILSQFSFNVNNFLNKFDKIKKIVYYINQSKGKFIMFNKNWLYISCTIVSFISFNKVDKNILFGAITYMMNVLNTRKIYVRGL